MANHVGGTPDYDTSRLYGAMKANRAALEQKVKANDVVGGVSVLGLGIPNSFLGGIARTDEQKQALSEPERYERAMQAVINALREALNVAHQPFNG